MTSNSAFERARGRQSLESTRLQTTKKNRMLKAPTGMLVLARAVWPLSPRTSSAQWIQRSQRTVNPSPRTRARGVRPLARQEERRDGEGGSAALMLFAPQIRKAGLFQPAGTTPRPILRVGRLTSKAISMSAALVDMQLVGHVRLTQSQGQFQAICRRNGVVIYAMHQEHGRCVGGDAPLWGEVFEKLLWRVIAKEALTAPGMSVGFHKAHHRIDGDDEIGA